MTTVSKEDYLKTIYFISSDNGTGVSTSKLSEKLNVSNAAISEMFKKLDRDGFLSHQKYKGVVLTKLGRKLALRVIRRHRLWELFLTKSLGLSWGKVHLEAEKFEHHTSEYLIDKIDEYLKFPKFDPHGHPIPSKNGEIPKLTGVINLLLGKIGVSYLLKRVDDESDELIEHLSNIGMKLNSTLSIVKKIDFDNSVIINVDNVNHSLSEKIASIIFIKKVD